MTQLSEAIARYHKSLEGGQFKDLSWAHELQERMQTRNLAVSGRPVSPVLRPHFITRRQYVGLVKAVEAFSSAIERIENMAIGSPALLSRIELLPAEKMLAAVDPGYPFLSVTSLIDTHLNNGTLRFARYIPDTPTGVAYGEALSDIFYDAPPVKQLRKRYRLEKLPGTKYLLQAILKAYKEWGGKNKKPNVAILEFRQPFQTAESGENALIADEGARSAVANLIAAETISTMAESTNIAASAVARAIARTNSAATASSSASQATTALRP